MIIICIIEYVMNKTLRENPNTFLFIVIFYCFSEVFHLG